MGGAEGSNTYRKYLAFFQCKEYYWTFIDFPAIIEKPLIVLSLTSFVPNPVIYLFPDITAFNGLKLSVKQ